VRGAALSLRCVLDTHVRPPRPGIHREASASGGATRSSRATRCWSAAAGTRVYPGHDYRGRLSSPIGEERRTNPRLLGRTREEFIDLMDHLVLPLPKRIHEGVPANLAGGVPQG